MTEEDATKKATEKKNHNYDWLKPYQFKKGQVGNPKGRPKGKSMKTWVREYFLSLSDEDKILFLNRIDPALAWQMAEGNPSTKIEAEIKDEPLENAEKIKELDKQFSDFLRGNSKKDTA